jgi:hypothetical protein
MEAMTEIMIDRESRERYAQSRKSFDYFPSQLPWKSGRTVLFQALSMIVEIS